MKLRRVLSEDGPQVEALQAPTQTWIPLAQLPGLDTISKELSPTQDLTKDILAVLSLGKSGWGRVEALLTDYQFSDKRHIQGILKPYQPSSFRDFLLFEDHYIDASRGYARRFYPRSYKLIHYYEQLTGKTFPKFKPAPLWYKQPLYYFANHLNFITNEEPILWPEYTQALDYELELGAILSKPLFNASEAEAQAAIGGYVVLNDLSARDVQKEEMASGFGPQKAKHFLSAMSHIVVTADEINHQIDGLHGTVSIDRKIIKRCSTANMRYSMAEAIAFVSRSEQLHCGELFGSGTLPGGSGIENGYWLQPDMQISLSIDGIAELSNVAKQPWNI